MKKLLASLAITALVALPLTAQTSGSAGGGASGGAAGGAAPELEQLELEQQPLVVLQQRQWR